MTKVPVLSVSAFVIFVSCLAVACLAHGQEGNGGTVYLPNEEVRVHDLPSLMAASAHRSAALTTELEIVFHDKSVCCGKDSALEDVALYTTLAGRVPLKELSAKLQGRHLLSSGRPIVVNADYVAQSSVNASLIVGALLEQHASLMEWKSHVYVLYGAIFDETRSYNGPPQYAIHKLLLLDPRFSDGRREVVFNRDTDDWENVQGLVVPVVAGQ